MSQINLKSILETEFIDQMGNVVQFLPYNSKLEGNTVTTFKSGERLGGEYKIKINTNNTTLQLGSTEFIFKLTEKGFDLISGETVSYNFTRIE